MTSIAEVRLWGRTIGAVTLADGADVAAFQYDLAFARNQDDHVKNIAFLMDQQGRWSLSPAFDVTYSFNPDGLWTATHQMTINGKRDHFELADFRACARTAGMKRGRAESILAGVEQVVARWPTYADVAGVQPGQRDRIREALRVEVR
ncbi:HipA domain-containing protein [Wenzhouxiangella sp. XN24]|uniref:HipA domain-containing protein n=1 Tax=Wenzhouxiangella sp. XN24 TaxID=2713569 RepID=UPI003211E762